MPTYERYQRKMRFFEMYWSVYKLCSNLFGEWVCFVETTSWRLKKKQIHQVSITVCSTPNKWYLLCWVSMTDDYCIAAWSSNIVAPSSKVGWSVSISPFSFLSVLVHTDPNCAQNAKVLSPFQSGSKVTRISNQYFIPFGGLFWI